MNLHVCILQCYQSIFTLEKRNMDNTCNTTHVRLHKHTHTHTHTHIHIYTYVYTHRN